VDLSIVGSNPTQGLLIRVLFEGFIKQNVGPRPRLNPRPSTQSPKSVARLMASAKLAEMTKRNYLMRVNQYVKAIGTTPDDLVREARAHPRKFEEELIGFVQKASKESSPSTTAAFRDSLKRFLEINRVEKINWGYINEFVPNAKKVGQDRAPTLEEIRKIIDVADLRTKCLILYLCSSGARIGSVEWLRWRDIEEVEHNGQKFARVTIYRGDPEEYVSFVTPECYRLLLEYRERRGNIGEKVTPQSYVFATQGNARDFDPSRIRVPSVKTLKNQLGELLQQTGMRSVISERGEYRNYEFKQAHGLRKFFRTRMEISSVKPIFTEMLMGRSTGVKDSYMKPTKNDFVGEYAKAIDNLTILTSVKEVAPQTILTTIRKEMLLPRYGTEEIAQLGDLSKLSNEQMVELLNKRAQPPAPKVAGTGGQRVVPAGEVRGMIEQGWEYLTRLPDGYVVMKLPKQATGP